ncbi:MAG: hypothetical protein ACJA2W_000885 [Planctomycetota bacterium]|jgi:hypothetical protein
MNSPSILSFLTTAVAGSILVSGAVAQDECASAAALSFDTATSFDTTSATPSAPDFSCMAGGGTATSQDVWFTFTSPADYMALATTCGTASYDTKMEVYEGACGALVSVACNDDTSGCAGFTTDLEFMATAGTQYYLRIGGWQLGDFGPGDVLLVGPPAPPYECVDAAEIVVDTLTSFDTTSATVSALPFSCAAGGGDLNSQDVWLKFTASADYMAQATTCGTASYDTKIEIYEGACGALISVACNDDTSGCAGFTTEVDWMAVTGTEYFVRIGGWQLGEFGPGQVLVTGAPAAVSNDECVAAIALSNGGMEMFDNTLATNSASDPDFSCGGVAANALDIWYTITPLSDSAIVVDTFGSAFDTRLEIYSGGCGALVSEACNDDSGSLQSMVSIAGLAGQTYHVRVAGFSGNSGVGQVNAMFADMLPNDDCSGAIAVGVGSTSYSNVGATDSLVDMSCVFNGETSDVWFSYTASGDCDVSIDLSGSEYDTGMAVYSGDCMTLVEVACDDDGGTGLDSFVSFAATAGTTYLVQVGGFNGSNGLGVMNITEGNGFIICLGEVNSTGVGADLKVTGSLLVVDNTVSLDVTALPMNSMGYFVHSAETIFVANPGGSTGNLCIASFDLGRFAGNVLDSGAAGAVSFSPDLDNMPGPNGAFAVLAGDTRNFQLWYRDVDGSGAPTSNFSSATSVTFQ